MSASRRLGVLVIKLVDRLHNLRTLHYLKQAKRQRIAQETVEVYAPIASMLNIAQLKRELYHLALNHLYPRKSKKILNITKGLRNAPEVLEIETSLKNAFSVLAYKVVVRPRVKGLGTYYDRLKRTLSLYNAENRMDFAERMARPDMDNSISINEPGPFAFGDPVTFTTTTEKLTGGEYSLIYVEAWQGDTLVYGQLDSPGATFIPGGGSSPWHESPGPATCKATLYAYPNIHKKGAAARVLAETPTFEASDPRA